MVVGVPDKKVGERIKAIVMLKDDVKGVGATELIRYCRERLASKPRPPCGQNQTRPDRRRLCAASCSSSYWAGSWWTNG